MAGKYENPKGGLNAAGHRKFGTRPGVKNYSSASDADKRRWVRWALRFTKTARPLRKPNGDPTRYALMFVAWGEPVPSSADAVKKVHQKALKRRDELKMGERASAAAENPGLWLEAVERAAESFRAFPSVHANGWALDYYRGRGGTWAGAVPLDATVTVETAYHLGDLDRYEAWVESDSEDAVSMDRP